MPKGGWLAAFFYFFLKMGALGLFLLGVLDSSFLTLPFANDVAVIVLSSLHHLRFWLYAIAATAGSAVGCYITYWIGRKGGESFIEEHMSRQQFERLKQRISGRGIFVLAVPAIIPPPFPFTPWVLAAGALDVPRNRFLAALSVFRFARFFAEGVIALFVGRKVIQWMHSAWFEHFIDGLVVLAIAASVYSVFKLVMSLRKAQQKGPQPNKQAA
jgi:membrane protein YqaA with SNARE-associated domain